VLQTDLKSLLSRQINQFAEQGSEDCLDTGITERFLVNK